MSDKARRGRGKKDGTTKPAAGKPAAGTAEARNAASGKPAKRPAKPPARVVTDATPERLTAALPVAATSMAAIATAQATGRTEGAGPPADSSAPVPSADATPPSASPEPAAPEPTPSAAAPAAASASRNGSSSSGAGGAAPPKGDATGGAAALTEFSVRNAELLAQNMARAVELAGRVAAAWMAPREAGRRQDDPVGMMSDLGQVMTRVTQHWMTDPRRALEAQTALFGRYLDLYSASIRRMAGEADVPEIRPDPGDKRFADPAWSDNEFFSFLKQAYLVTSQWAQDIVARTEGLDDRTRHKATFYTQQIVNSLSPSNFPVTNPEVLRETLASDGANLVRGMSMLAEDMERGDGELRLRQTDTSAFVVGRDMANTPGKVVHQNDVCQVIQYEPRTNDVLARPLVIVPPWINKFYILDLNPQKSFVRWCLDQGHTVFVVSWVNPDENQAGKSFENYAREGVLETLDVVEDITGAREFNMIGYCVGGTLLAVVLALMAREGDRRAASATFLTTQVDFTHAGDLKVFADEAQIARVEKTMAEKGYLDGSHMASAFNMLRSRELIWPYVVNNYMKGKEPMPFDLLYWNSDATRMPAANHSFYLRNCYLENRLSEGTMEVGGAPIDLSRVTVPIYNLATREDHIAPARSAFVGSAAFGGEVTYVLSGSGHIAGVVNPPAAGKYQFWSGGPPEGRFEDWLAQAEEHAGSWWPHWQRWIEAQDATRVPARAVGSATHRPLEEAPGSYVLAKA